MIGFDPIGQGAIGELAGDAQDVLIFVPAALSVTASKVAPAIAGGGSAIVPSKTVTAAAVAPAVRAGAQVLVSALSAAAATVAPSVQISATVTVPSLSATVALTAPRLDAGVLVTVPAKATSVAVAAPVVAAGKQVAVPPKEAVVTLPAPIVAIGMRIQPGPLLATATLPAPQILTGNYIEVSNTITMQTPYGEIASSSIGQFAIGEGEVSSRIVKRGLLAIASFQPPFITAGKSVTPPTIHATATLGRPEIDSRRRKLRILAIAS
jgi:hypothetical protein